MFAFNEAITNIRRNLIISIITFITISISYMIVALVVVVTSQISNIGKYWDINTINIYLCSDQIVDAPCNGVAVNDQQRSDIADALKKNRAVTSVKYEDSNTAYRRFVKQYRNSDITKVVLPNQLQDSYRIRLKTDNKKESNAIVESVKKMPGVSDVINSKDTIGRSIAVLNNIRKIALLISFIISIFSIFLMVNIIHLSAATKSNEMKIMKLIGAYPSTIKLPFILQNLILTISAAMISSVTLYMFYNYLISHFFSNNIIAFSLSKVSFITNLTSLIFAYSLASMLIGYFAISRHTKV